MLNCISINIIKVRYTISKSIIFRKRKRRKIEKRIKAKLQSFTQRGTITLIARTNLLAYRCRLLNWTREDELVSKPIRTAVTSARNLQVRATLAARRTTLRSTIYTFQESLRAGERGTYHLSLSSFSNEKIRSLSFRREMSYNLPSIIFNLSRSEADVIVIEKRIKFIMRTKIFVIKCADKCTEYKFYNS